MNKFVVFTALLAFQSVLVQSDLLGLGMSSGTYYLAVAAFQDSNCQTIFQNSTALVVQSGVCTYSSLLNTYFNVTYTPGSINVNLDCSDSTCSSCTTTNNSTNELLCLPLGTLGGTQVYGKAYPLSSSSMIAEIYPSGCSTSSGTFTLSAKANTCTQVNISGLTLYAVAAELVGISGSEVTGIGLAFECDSSCNCETFQIVQPNTCTPVSATISVSITSAASTKSFSTLLILFIFVSHLTLF